MVSVSYFTLCYDVCLTLHYVMVSVSVSFHIMLWCLCLTSHSVMMSVSHYTMLWCLSVSHFTLCCGVCVLLHTMLWYMSVPHTVSWYWSFFRCFTSYHTQVLQCDREPSCGHFRQLPHVLLYVQKLPGKVIFHEHRNLIQDVLYLFFDFIS